MRPSRNSSLSRRLCPGFLGFFWAWPKGETETVVVSRNSESSDDMEVSLEFHM